MRILTFNLRHNNDHWEQRKPLCINLIEQHQPDLIGFQEVWMPIRQAHIILEHVIGTPYRVHTSPKQGQHGMEGIAIASRYPTSKFEKLNLPGGERVAQRIQVTVDGHVLWFVNTHLHHRPINNESERHPQMQAILDWLNPITEPIILTGDMNTIPTRSTIQLANTRFISAYAQARGAEPDYTFPAPLAAGRYDIGHVMIDYIFITPNDLMATSGQVVGDKAHGENPVLSASDHLGVLVDVTFL